MAFAQPEGGVVHVRAVADVSLDRGLRLPRVLFLWQTIDE
jgi:hypothetical protein